MKDFGKSFEGLCALNCVSPPGLRWRIPQILLLFVKFPQQKSKPDSISFIRVFFSVNLAVSFIPKIYMEISTSN